MLSTQAGVRYGTVQYERGIEIVEVEGFLDERDGWVLVYGDRDAPPTGQRNTAIPVARVVEVDSQPLTTYQRVDMQLIAEP